MNEQAHGDGCLNLADRASRCSAEQCKCPTAAFAGIEAFDGSIQDVL